MQLAWDASKAELEAATGLAVDSSSILLLSSHFFFVFFFFVFRSNSEKLGGVRPEQDDAVLTSRCATRQREEKEVLRAIVETGVLELQRKCLWYLKKYDGNQ